MDCYGLTWSQPSCISTAELNTLRCVHLPPIQPVVCRCTYLLAEWGI